MTDPSGYSWVSKKWKQIRRAAVTVVGAVVGTVVGFVAGCFAGGPAGCFVGAKAGFTIGATMAYSYRYGKDKGLSHHDALDASAKAGVTTAASIAISYGIGSGVGKLAERYKWSPVTAGIARVALHGAKSGAISDINGGKFSYGAFIGAAGVGYGEAFGDGFLSFDKTGVLSSLEQVTVAAAAGKLIGADSNSSAFAQQVFHSLLAYHFNQLLHPKAAQKTQMADKADKLCSAAPICQTYDALCLDALGEVMFGDKASCSGICRLEDGTQVPVGTQSYRHDQVPPSKPHHPFTGDHVHIYEAHQIPKNCDCFWKPVDIVEPPPPSNAIPIQPFRNPGL